MLPSSGGVYLLVEGLEYEGEGEGGGQFIHKELLCLCSIHFNVVKYSCVINLNLRVHGAETDECKCKRRL